MRRDLSPSTTEHPPSAPDSSRTHHLTERPRPSSQEGPEGFGNVPGREFNSIVGRLFACSDNERSRTNNTRSNHPALAEVSSSSSCIGRRIDTSRLASSLPSENHRWGRSVTMSDRYPRLSFAAFDITDCESPAATFRLSFLSRWFLQLQPIIMRISKTLGSY